MPLIIELSRPEQVEAIRIANHRRREASAGQYRRRIEGTYQEDLLGAACELAVARWAGVPHPGWQGDVSWRADIDRGCDVAGWQVRGTRYRSGGLALDAPPRPLNTGRFILGLGHDYPRIWLAGCISAEEGYRVAELRHDGVGQKDWYRVPGHLLRPLTSSWYQRLVLRNPGIWD